MVNAVDNVLKYQVTMWLLFNIIIYNFYFFFFIKETCPDFSSNCQLKSLSSDIIRTDNCVSLQKVEGIIVKLAEMPIFAPALIAMAL
jgi:hypothetical protein